MPAVAGSAPRLDARRMTALTVRRALGALLVGIVVLTGCASGASPTPTAQPSPSDVPSTPTPAPSAPSTPSPAPSAPAPPAFGDTEAVTVPERPVGSSILAIVAGGDGLVAIGFDGAFGTLIWTSADGRTWRDVTPEGFSSVGIVSVVEFEGMLVGVGRGSTTDVDAQQAAVYLSDDGLVWRTVESDELVGQMIDVVATDDGLYAVGGVPGADAAGIWHSVDGETWQRTGGEFDHAFMWAIAEGGPGLVAVGWRRNPEPDLAVWTSADGVTWTLAPDPEGFAGYEATDVAALPDGTLAMVGNNLMGGPGRMWVSADGVEWTLAEADGVDDAAARALTRIDGGLVAVGGGSDAAARAWFGADGRSWTLIGDPLPEAYFTSAFETDGGLLVTGATQTGTLETGIETRAGIWLLPRGG
jgi:hypothetical protein